MNSWCRRACQVSRRTISRCSQPTGRRRHVTAAKHGRRETCRRARTCAGAGRDVPQKLPGYRRLGRRKPAARTEVPGRPANHCGPRLPMAQHILNRLDAEEFTYQWHVLRVDWRQTHAFQQLVGVHDQRWTWKMSGQGKGRGRRSAASGEGRFACNYCSFRSNSRAGIGVHVRKAHLVEEPSAARADDGGCHDAADPPTRHP
jgi:hypothetical protein